MRIWGAPLAIVVAMGLAGASVLPRQSPPQSTPETTEEAKSPDPSSVKSLDRKLEQIRNRHAEGAETSKRFNVSEEEANAYLVYRVAEQLPPEVTKPWVRFGVDQIQGGALLDASLIDTYLKDSFLAGSFQGQVEVEVLTQVVAKNGVGQVELESITLGGIPIPGFIIKRLVAANSKNPALPEGVRLDDPFPLPYGIVSAKVKTGRLILKQGPVRKDEATQSGSSAH
jgi:hypothetical protein